MKKFLMMIALFVSTAAHAGWNGIEAAGGVGFGLGSAGSRTSIEGRLTDSLALWAAPQYNFNSLIGVPLKAGLYGSYEFIGDTAATGGTNLRGQKLAGGFSLGYSLQNFTAIAAFVPFAGYNFSNNIAGLSASASGATGFALAIGYQPWKTSAADSFLSNLSFDLLGEYTSFGKETVGSGSATDLPSNDKITTYSVGVGVSYRY